ncbi:MAG: hypothetical protein PHX87_03545 [Candidatus Peribacteraceae bacterium]|nr:hypothetical protein [Candidatus Peribacteraceae bacterium]MDD5742480.1 hypothetical protein [Candidatus Peribacteraceae bacterium]
MSVSQLSPADAPSGGDRRKGSRVEILPKFIPTPERLSQYLEMNIQEVALSLQSVDGRRLLFNKLMEHEQDLRNIDPAFNPDFLNEQLELAGEVLRQKDRFLKDVKSPEKKGLFARAWEKMKSFGKGHPFVSAILLLALIAGGTALALYATGNLELAATKLGLGKVFGAADAAGEMMPPVPGSPLPPGAGELAVPPPAQPIPGAGGPI